MTTMAGAPQGAPESQPATKEEPPTLGDWGPGVSQLEPGNFDNVLKAAKRSLVMFYAPWCPHCKNIKPEFSKASSSLKAGQIMAALDCSKFSDFCKGKGVNGYPTLQIFENGAYLKDYSGKRSAGEFLEAIDVNLSAPKVEL